MSVRKRIFLAILVSLNLLGVVALVRQDETPCSANLLYAYLTQDSLVAMLGTRLVGKITGRFSSDASPIWTLDGRYVAVIEGADDPQQIAVIDTKTHISRYIPCRDCTGLAAFGGSEIGAISLTNQGPAPASYRLLRSNLIDTAPPVSLSTDFPTSWPIMKLRSLVGLPGQALFAGAEPDKLSAYGGPEELFVLDREGSARSVGGTDSNIQVGPAAATTRSIYGGPRVAIVGGWHNSACEATQDITILDPATQKIVNVQMDSVRPAGHHNAGGIAVTDIWWGYDGHLYATIQAWDCRYGRDDEPEIIDEPKVIVTPSSLWRLEADRWVKVDSGPLRAVRMFNREARVILVPDGNSVYGVLYMEIRGRGVLVARSVLAIAVRRDSDTSFDAKKTFAPYVGVWWQHGYTLTIKSDFTGELVGFNFGTPGGTIDQPGYLYRERAILVFAVKIYGITGTVTSSEGSDGTAPAWKVGTKFMLHMNAYPGVIDLNYSQGKISHYCGPRIAYRSGLCGG